MSGKVVADASLAVKWVLVEPLHAEARAVLVEWGTRRVLRLAPALFASEVIAILLKQRRRGVLTASEAQEAHDLLLAGVRIRPHDAALASRALEIADGLGMWKAYDSLYLALAEREGCEHWTADEKFVNAAVGQFPAVRWLGAYSPP